MELRRGVTVTPKFLALVFPVRIGAAQQTWQARLKTNHLLLTAQSTVGKRETCNLPPWRNRQTRHTQNVVPQGVPVRFRPGVQNADVDVIGKHHPNRGCHE